MYVSVPPLLHDLEKTYTMIQKYEQRQVRVNIYDDFERLKKRCTEKLDGINRNYSCRAKGRLNEMNDFVSP